jgi:hypothetical protein
VREGIEELYEAFGEYGLTVEDLEGPRYMRIRHVLGLVDRGELDTELRWIGSRGGA